jgi:hemerythrin-like domain-containing protein
MKTHHAHRASADPLDAIELLKHAHRDIAELFSYFDTSEADDQRFIAGMICKALTAHAQLEDEIFNPVARDALGAEAAGLLDQEAVEHESLATLIAEIRASAPDAESPGTDLFVARVKVLRDYVKHHVRHEEHELFPKVRASALDLHALGAALAERQRDLEQAVTSRLRAPDRRMLPRRARTRVHRVPMADVAPATADALL